MKLVWFVLGLSVSVAACSDNNQDKVVIPNQAFVEEFDTAFAAEGRGWVFVNSSNTLGDTKWSNPQIPPFEPYSSSVGSSGYLWADYNSTASAAGVISNWAVSPILILQNGDRISFYTRSQLYYYDNDSTDFSNRLQVRLNLRNTGTNTGSGVDPGDFNVLLLDINPNYYPFLYQPYQNKDPQARQAYPHRWTRFEAVVSGLAEPVESRFAFRYYVEEAGNNGRGTAVGIDRVTFQQAK
jgi:hypothetical protein